MNDVDATLARVDYRVDPESYRHWKLTFDGPIANLAMDVAEEASLRPGYRLKLNSYDLGVDIELADALNRIRFEHPDVRVVVVTSAKDRIFCSGANIFMLGSSSHAWKVNFCKFTNETRNGMEDSSAHSGLRFLAAVNGTCAGGGYELALACDEIVLVDDRSSAVSLPEVPLLGVLPGTGGLTRLTDKRRVRPDHADIFCTTAEGVRGERALDWRLVDAIAKPAQFAQSVRERALRLAASSTRPAGAKPVKLPRLERSAADGSLEYSHVRVAIDRSRRLATFTVKAPQAGQPSEPEAMQDLGASWWPLAIARELEDAILWMRTNELDTGTWIFETEGDGAAVLACDTAMKAHESHGFVREVIGYLRRTFARLDVSSRSIYALVKEGSCFAGTLAELAFAADRTYMLSLASGRGPAIALSPMNFGAYPMVNGRTRLRRRLCGDEAALSRVETSIGRPLDARAALELGLVTSAPDDIDWPDEVRIALEERAAMSPDALTGLEANLRFGGGETMATRIFGRLTAWQNWIFQRPNAVGEKGALKVYGKGEKAAFDWKRV